MTKEYSNLRSIVANLGDPDILAEFDSDDEARKVGHDAINSRAWIPLCPSYPNLKGVSCDDIKKFTKNRLPEYFYSDEYQSKVNELSKRYEEAYDAEPKDEFGGIADPLFTYTGKGGEIKHDFIDLVFDHLPEEMKEEVLIGFQGYSFKTLVDRINNTYKQQYTYEKGYQPIQSRDTTEDYFHHVRVYDRDETYEAFQKIGHQIERDTPGILHDKSTIFVTTPRGGYEMLSTFAYANKIDKNQIPSDIKFRHITPGAPISEDNYMEDPISAAKYLEKIGYEEGDEIPTDVYGITWLRDMSSHIKTIFIVDDIIASGAQISTMAYSLVEMFPDAKINSVTLCKRDNVQPALPIEIDKYYNDTSTTGIDKFNKMHRDGKPFGKEYITCLFPHACPDGSSDHMMTQLMGERCSPEKRIAERDL